MYRTIEAIYDNGKVYPVEDIKIKKGRVLLTTLEEDKEKEMNEKKECFFKSLETLSFELPEDYKFG